MRIITDIEGRKVIEQLCDIALRAGGLQNIKGVSDILIKMEDYQEPPIEVKTETNV